MMDTEGGAADDGVGVTLGPDQMIPFPQEHHMMLGQELINVCNPDVLIIFDVGAGEMMKAALAQRVLCVGIVANKTHRDTVMDVLRKDVHGLNLVDDGEGHPAIT